MDARKQSVQVRVDPYTRVCLTVIAVLMTVLIVGLWADGPPSAEPAMGRARAPGTPFVNAGQQRERMIEALTKNTAKIDQLISLFQSGKARVQIADDGKREGKQRAIKPDAK